MKAKENFFLIFNRNYLNCLRARDLTFYEPFNSE
jgi:hypothetical protein